MNKFFSAGTGFTGLDEILQGLEAGDNVVWQADSLEDYLFFVTPFVKQALKERKKIIYIRFARHEPLIQTGQGIKEYKLDAAVGFESFAKEIHKIITEEGEGAYYVFDCLSDLLSAWATDLMIGNFFMVTCPYLFKLNTVAYFAILRNRHSFRTIARIRETTQVLLDIYNIEGNYYLHPLKVLNRYSPTMFLPHLKKEGAFIPLVNSLDAARLFSYISGRGAENVRRNLDYWDRLFLEAQELAHKSANRNDHQKMVDRIIKIMIGRETRMTELARTNFSLEDLLGIKARLLGTGYIGGKAVGMLLARKILEKDKSFAWQNYLEPHDSFYIGSDVFYSYLVQNGWWELWLKHKTREEYFAAAAELKEKMLQGGFPEEIREQFYQMIEYFGQAPIIVRSSSLLEDSFGNAFAGKYESIFVANQGSPEERYHRFVETVRRVFASTLSEDALNYRWQRKLSEQEEQMALLVQRVSGKQRQKYFFPYLGGVGVSYNPFVWHEDMDPSAGMVRIVLGLGTRAVNRAEGDYSRIVALDAPQLKPYAGLKEVRKYSQTQVDLISLKENKLQTVPLTELVEQGLDLDLDLIGTPDRETEQKKKELGMDGPAWILNFDKVLSQTDLAQDLKNLMKILERAYQYPVDIEFTVNFTDERMIRVNLVQCRPLQAKKLGSQVEIPAKIENKKIFIRSTGNFMGGSVDLQIKRIIYVDPASYVNLKLQEKYQIARLIGQLNRQIADREAMPALLLGPGRWGTSDPSLGIPVSFSEINHMTVLGEISFPRGGMIPELSFGTHFFLDLIETETFYVAIFPEKKEVIFNQEWLDNQKNSLTNLLPEAEAYQGIIKVYDLSKNPLRLLSDLATQQLICIKSQ
jgi:hypothetical protein